MLTYTDDTANTMLAILGSLVIVGLSLTVILLSYIITAIILSFIFKKAKTETWKAWVPFYNVWVLFEIAGYKGWLSLAIPAAGLLLSPIPVIGFLAHIAMFIAYLLVFLNLQKAFSKEPVFIILYIFLPIVWLAILAFDKSKYDASLLETIEPEILSNK